MAATLEAHYRATLDGSHESFELTHDERIYQVEAMPIPSPEQPTGLLLLQDVTEGYRVKVLAATNAELDRLNRTKSEFVSVVSHEFRTPLTSIQAFSELLRDESFPETQVREFAADINSEAERLTRLISDLLDLDRLESGQIAMQTDALDLNALVHDAVATAPPHGPQHEVRLDLDPDLPPVPGDRDKLVQVVLNLLSNALKYSPDGGVVTVGTRGEPGQAHLWVQDQGIGIAAADLETIFERYRRVASESTAAIQGTGLGLPIVRQIAELHGGRAWAESEPGVGSTFHVVLPFRSE